MNDKLRFGLLPLAARLLLVAEFVIAINGKIADWDGQAQYMAVKGMHFIVPLLAAALAIEVIGAICLITGVFASRAAAVLFVYLGIVSIELYAFWNQTGMSASISMGQFFKNLGMMGGLLMIAVYGPGRWTLRRRRVGALPVIALIVWAVAAGAQEAPRTGRDVLTTMYRTYSSPAHRYATAPAGAAQLSISESPLGRGAHRFRHVYRRRRDDSPGSANQTLRRA